MEKLSHAHFIDTCRKQFLYYKQLGEKTMAQLTDDDLFLIDHRDGNSISIIVNHLSGNMKSRWTDFLISDGEKEWRNREGEFVEAYKNRAELLTAWDEGWQILLNALDQVNAGNWNDLVYIRNQGHTILEAVLRQLAHYSYHVGQIVVLGKLRRGADWQSLSIPRGQSQVYNAAKFAQDKSRGHFTDEYLGDNQRITN